MNRVFTLVAGALSVLAVAAALAPSVTLGSPSVSGERGCPAFPRVEPHEQPLEFAAVESRVFTTGVTVPCLSSTATFERWEVSWDKQTWEPVLGSSETASSAFPEWKSAEVEVSHAYGQANRRCAPKQHPTYCMGSEEVALHDVEPVMVRAFDATTGKLEAWTPVYVKVLPGRDRMVVNSVETARLSAFVEATLSASGIRSRRELRARVTWGDGLTTPARVVGREGRAFSIRAVHGWTLPGVYRVTITLSDRRSGATYRKTVRIRVPR